MQRAGNTHRAGLGDSAEMMNFKNFMSLCAEVLTQNSDDNSAFWFEQLAEYFADGGNLTNDKKEIARILGL